MKVIIAGSRSITDYNTLLEAIEESGFEITIILSGHAKGVDQLGERYAEEHDIPNIQFLPNWSVGKHAGFMRNSEMVEEADALIAVYDGKSKGTKDTVTKMRKANKRIYVKYFNPTNNRQISSSERPLDYE